ncbi:MAG TPA: hypothetical protein VM434_04515, partial [Beijerinckiaceae bacterium]|nr:hypothetical protein [Beijerinckiaceae bacterium]
RTAAAFGLVAVAASASAAQQGPFTGLTGSWSGSGTLVFASGAREALRCRAQYMAREGGDTVRHNLLCASSGDRFEFDAELQHSGGEVTGIWAETTRNVSGNVNGRAAGGRIDATLSSPVFAAGVAVITRGNQQSVLIQAPGSRVQEVKVELRKSR